MTTHDPSGEPLYKWLTEIAYERAQHFVAGFLSGRPPKQSKFIQDVAFEMFKYSKAGLEALKFEGSLKELAWYIIAASDEFDAACRER